MPKHYVHALSMAAVCSLLMAPAQATPLSSHQSTLLPSSTRQAAPPRLWQQKPPSETQRRFSLPERSNTRGVRSGTTPQCMDMKIMASYSGNALANYLAGLPDYECTYNLFSLDSKLGATIYSAANLNAVAARFSQEAGAYNASNMALVNMALYLRAGYYLADSNIISHPDAALVTVMRPAIRQLLNGNMLFNANATAPSTAGEVMKLITNIRDETYYLPQMKAVMQRYTNKPSQPGATQQLRDNNTAAQGFTGMLTVMFYASSRPEAQPLLQNDPSYSAALFDFVMAGRSTLSGTETAYQLGDAARESLRFMRYPALKDAIRPQIKALLAGSSMTGKDNELWLAAAEAIKFNDSGRCSEYGTCNYEQQLADAVLVNSYSCDNSIRIRAQEMTLPQMQASCALLQKEQGYFHQMMKTGKTPVADDTNTALEIVVFDDYNNYAKYASVIYGIATDNGGMYEEGDPAQPGNQARFIAHEASWLRPLFSVWNLEHEYVHYLDGRFDLYGDFAMAVQQPTVWWLEGIAEYISLRNNNQQAIDTARSGQYPLSTIFTNTYGMPDYVNRAYRWGYMATRFMMEKHRSDIDAMMRSFRKGDYAGYAAQMKQIGSRYDKEFAGWVRTATTDGQPPLPGGTLPPCTGTWPSQLGKNCSIGNLAATSGNAAYLTIQLPAGARNLRLFSNGGSGDMDMYLAAGYYPNEGRYDQASRNTGNNEAIDIAAPQTGRWYYLTLKAKQAFSGVSVSASYD